MAQNALPPGAVRRRAAFGMLDADGWGWAGIKALFWFLTIIFLLGYIPNTVYYATVSDTVDVGANFISPLNWCPASNEDLPCPAPAGAIVPWQASPAELALPSARQGMIGVQSGANIYLVGGTDASGNIIPGTLATKVSEDGNFSPWTDGPALPEPRRGAAYTSLSGVPYIIGGLGPDGAPTDTVYIGVLDAGVLTGWALADGTDGHPDLKLPTPIAGASAVATPQGLWLFGGRTADGLVDTVLRSKLDTSKVPPTLQAWEEQKDTPLPMPRADAVGAVVGNYLYVIGGFGPTSATNSVYRMTLKDGDPVISEGQTMAAGWTMLPPSQNIPATRARAASMNANGTIYLIGGVDADGNLQYSTLWAIGNAAGDLTWHYLDQSNLTVPRAGSASALVGATAFIFGGQGPDGAVDGSFRADISPKAPFLRLGILGATLPGLSIKGEIGQQLGYINAMTVGMINFALLVLIGIAFSHRKQTLHVIEKITRGRFKAPREDEYTPSA